jgi:uncharacterized protein
MTNRTIVITGASSGIGAQFARSYAQRGVNLILVARRLDRLDALGADLSQTHGISCLAISADLSKSEAVSSLVNKLKTHDIDGLINNAGFSVARQYAKTDWASQAEFIQVCVTTPAHLAHALLPPMLVRGYGRMINISSIAAFNEGSSGHTLYPAAKAFVLKMSRSLAAESKRLGVNITAVCPGSTESDFQSANGMREIMDKNPLPIMSAKSVVEMAIKANEAGKEVLIPGLGNHLACFAMKHLPDPIITPLVRWAAQKYQLMD